MSFWKKRPEEPRRDPYAGMKMSEAAQQDRGSQRRMAMSNPIFAERLLPGCEQLDIAYGPFGTTSMNPIPVNGPMGERIYLNSLRTEGGGNLMYHRLGTTSLPGYGLPLDVFEVAATDGTYRDYLFFSPYHMYRSRQLPDQLRQANWLTDVADEIAMTLERYSGLGVTMRLSNFPEDLPQALRCDRSLILEKGGEMVNCGAIMADELIQVLESRTGDWERSKPFPADIQLCALASLEPWE